MCFCCFSLFLGIVGLSVCDFVCFDCWIDCFWLFLLCFSWMLWIILFCCLFCLRLLVCWLICCFLIVGFNGFCFGVYCFDCLVILNCLLCFVCWLLGLWFGLWFLFGCLLTLMFCLVVLCLLVWFWSFDCLGILWYWLLRFDFGFGWFLLAVCLVCCFVGFCCLFVGLTCFVTFVQTLCFDDLLLWFVYWFTWFSLVFIVIVS